MGPSAFSPGQEPGDGRLTQGHPGGRQLKGALGAGNQLPGLHWSVCVRAHVQAACLYVHSWASVVAQMVKNLSAMQETRVQSLGQEDPWEKGMATHTSILAWRIPWTEEPGGLQSMVLQSRDD